MNGNSPDNPVKTIGAASGLVKEGGKIYVAEGVYEKCHAYIRDISFELLGGYNDSFTERDVENFVTILDGAEQKDGYSVIAANADLLIDGFTIQNGADGGIIIGFTEKK